MKNILLVLIAFISFGCNGNAQDKNQKNYAVAKTDSEWRKELSTAEYQVLRKGGTERAFSSELNNVSEPGTFVCAACGNALYKTRHKFDSGTGWPSFDRPISEENVDYRPDRTGGFPATEVLCSSCGGHLGHVFNDGPKRTTGKRHCINGIAMDFVPDNE